LEAAAEEHEQLRAEVESLQEKHFEVLAALRETEDELRGHRHRAALFAHPKRLASTKLFIILT
jgi:hypothetical protein